MVWTLHYADPGAKPSEPTSVAVVPDLARAFETARDLMALGKIIHEIRGEEGTRIPRSLIEQRVRGSR